MEKLKTEPCKYPDKQSLLTKPGQTARGTSRREHRLIHPRSLGVVWRLTDRHAGQIAFTPFFGTSGVCRDLTVGNFVLRMTGRLGMHDNQVSDVAIRPLNLRSRGLSSGLSRVSLVSVTYPIAVLLSFQPGRQSRASFHAILRSWDSLGILEIGER